MALEFKLLQRAENYPGDNSLSFHVGSEANVAINVFDNTLTMSLAKATSIGAVQQRLEHIAANLTTANENVQAIQAMFAQANQSSSSVIGLLL